MERNAPNVVTARLHKISLRRHKMGARSKSTISMETPVTMTPIISVFCVNHAMSLLRINPAPQVTLVCVLRRQLSEGNPSTRLIKDTVDYSQGSIEMKANDFFEVDFRNWLLRYIKEHGSILRTDAEDGGGGTGGV